MPTEKVANEVFKSIEYLESATNSDAIMNVIINYSAEYGATYFIFTRIPNKYQNFRDMIYAKRWPAEWYDFYTRNRLIDSDPIAEHCLKMNDPFYWSDCPTPRGRAKTVMLSARDCGLKDGWSVPLHTFDGTGCASFAGASLSLTNDARRGLHLLTMYAAERLRVVDEARKAQSIQLTGREKDVLLLTAWGKTVLEVGEILGLTPRTIGHHVRSAAAKLGANTKAQAVVMAMQRRCICP